MKTLQSKYKIQHEYVIDEEELLSVIVIKISLKKDLFKSFLICDQFINNKDETVNEYVTYYQLFTFKTTF